MDYGIRIVNDSGTVQIDDTYTALCLFQKGTATFVEQPLPSHASGSFSTREHQATITIAGANNPVMAIRSDYYCNIISRKNNGDGTWTFVVDGEPASSGQAFDWYVFDNQPPAAAGWGLNARNAAGQVAFSSDARPMRFVDLFSAVCAFNTQTPPAPQSFSYGAGRVYAFLPGRVASTYNWFAQNITQEKYLFVCGGKTTADGVSAGQMKAYDYVFSNTSTPNFGWTTQDYDMLVVDVTNY